MYAKLQQIGKRIQYMQLNYIKINPDFLILRLFHFPLFTRNAPKKQGIHIQNTSSHPTKKPPLKEDFQSFRK